MIPTEIRDLWSPPRLGQGNTAGPAQHPGVQPQAEEKGCALKASRQVELYSLNSQELRRR